MGGMEAVWAGCALATSVAAGLLAHEYAHALVLTLFGIDHRVTLLPRRNESAIGSVLRGPLATVHPRPTGTEAPWQFRVAALAPLAMVLPVGVLAAFGAVPGGETPIRAAFLVGWLACALPSPQDFSVVFHAHRVLAAAHTGDDRVDGRTDPQ